MKVRQLKQQLENMSSKNVNATMTSVSHWIKKVYDSPKGQYPANTLQDIETLEKLAGLGIFSMRKGPGTAIITELTQEGKELFKDFTALGYYL